MNLLVELLLDLIPAPRFNPRNCLTILVLFVVVPFVLWVVFVDLDLF
jgi:hypothetical protein